ncbi:MAG: hypothetical protein M1830_009397 [Pleopsidium flavum]|nr:MAG: hypothetical protein M1830_009397 [Pleopsidium flavum]
MPPFIPRKRRRSPSLSQSLSNGTQKTSASKPTLFDTLDAKLKDSNTVDDNKAFLAELNGDSDSSLSDISSSEFEDAIPNQPFSKRRRVEEDDDAEDGIDWEDAMGPDETIPSTPAALLSGDLEITLDKSVRIGSLTNPHSKKKGPSKKEREIRVVTHCMHVQFLMFHNLVRNAWVCDDEVQKILVAQLPLGVKKEIEKWRLACGMLSERSQEVARISGKAKGKQVAERTALKHRTQRDWGQKAERQEEGVPNMSRGDPLIRLLKILAAYWKKRFTSTAPGLRKQGYKALETLEAEIVSFRSDSHSAEEHGERISDLAQFREQARKCEGSRDVGAQLFTALIRGLGIEARMVASIQPVGFGWSKSEQAAVKRRKDPGSSGKLSENAKQSVVDAGSIEAAQDSSSDMSLDEPIVITQRKAESGPGAYSKKLAARKRSGKGAEHAPIDMSEDSSEPSTGFHGDDNDSVIDVTRLTPRKAPTKTFDKDLPFPIYWTEVASPITKDIIPVDPLILTPPVATNGELLSLFEPRGAKADMAKQVLAYVVAFSSDGTAKDVTTRYLKRHMWPGKTKGMRLPVERVPIYDKRGKVKRYEEFDWFKGVISGYTRTHSMRTAVDDLEEPKDLKPVKPEKKVATEGEETVQGYKNSAQFVLERHLRREEALLPGAQHVKVFVTGKGDKEKEEKVFRREDVMVCRTGESWHKEGRQVKPREYPMKMVPVRAVTLTRKREVEEAERDGGEKLKQGLYAWDQTEWIIPPPIQNGIIPKNAFGNIDCYVPTMVPQGAVHIRRKGTMKVCKRLGIDFAEAVTGFEFGKQRAVPVITGVVVAKEYEKMVVDAWKLDEEERRRKEEGKREKAALAMWRKFLMGLRIVERVREEYGGADAHMKEEMNPFTNQNKGKQRSSNIDTEQDLIGHSDARDNEDHDMAGGFIPEDLQDGIDEGGFMPVPSRNTEESIEFMVDHGDPAAARKSLMTGVFRKNPTSLQSTHREVLHEPGPRDTDKAPSPKAAKAASVKRVRQKSQQSGSKAAKSQQIARRAIMRAAKSTNNIGNDAKQKRRATHSDMEDGSSELSSLQSDSDSEPSNDASVLKKASKTKRRIVDKNLLPHDALQIATPPPTSRKSTRAKPKRNAARKSESPVKSHYFDRDGSDDESGQDSGTSVRGVTQGSLEEKTFSNGEIQKAPGRR